MICWRCLWWSIKNAIAPSRFGRTEHVHGVRPTLTIIHCAALPDKRKRWQVIPAFNNTGYYCRHYTKIGARLCSRRKYYKPHKGVRWP